MIAFEYQTPNSQSTIDIHCSDHGIADIINMLIEQGKVKLYIPEEANEQEDMPTDNGIKNTYKITGTRREGITPEYTISEHTNDSWSCNCPHYYYRLSKQFPDNIWMKHGQWPKNICPHIPKAQKLSTQN